MTKQITQNIFLPLPGGEQATYTGSTLRFRHSDWLGTYRFETNTSEQEYGDVAYAPFGEKYAVLNTPYLGFTGQNQDTVTGTYDFLYREYNPTQGRWISPDPAGLNAMDPTNPQSFNRYAYVINNPLSITDPLGLDSCAGATGLLTQSQNFEDSIASGGTGLLPCVASVSVTVTAPQDGVETFSPGDACAMFGICGRPQPGLSFSPKKLQLSNSWVKNTARKIGSHIPTLCGGGVFNYGGLSVGPAAATVAVADWKQADTRTGYSEGVFGELSTGEGITGGYGQQGPLGGDQESYFFFGVGGKLPAGPSGNFSEFVSDSGSFGIALEGSTGRAVGGVGYYFNVDSLTSCYDHGGR
jgi:RHS repeat-associated protein